MCNVFAYRSIKATQSILAVAVIQGYKISKLKDCNEVHVRKGLKLPNWICLNDLTNYIYQYIKYNKAHSKVFSL